MVPNDVRRLLLASAVVLAGVAPGQARFDAGMRTSHLPDADIGNTKTFAMADLDGDGDLDLVAIRESGQDRIWINDGLGRFTDQTAARFALGPTATWAVAAADLDGDGDVDLVMAAGSGQDRLYRNDGTGSFTDDTAAALPAVARFSRSVAIADVDGDGDRDLVLGQAIPAVPQQRQPVLLTNDGSGHFTDVSATALPPTASFATCAFARDFNGDGWVDLLLLGTPNQMLHNTGTGTFAAAPVALPAFPPLNVSAADVGDIDGDGDLDVVLVAVFASAVWRNDGTGAFVDVTASSLPLGQDAPVAVCLFDGDGDGALDLALGNAAFAPDRLYRNSGTGVFQPWPSTFDGVRTYAPRSVHAADLDGDGAAELLFSSPSMERLYHNEGSGGFTPAQRPRLGIDVPLARDVVFGDFDGDGIGDVALASGGAPWLRLFANDGLGNCSERPGALRGTEAQAIAAGDFDGDGHVDLVAGCNGTNSWFRNDGSGTFALPAMLPGGAANTATVAIGDIDGDGDPDVFFGNLGQQDQLLRNDGHGNFIQTTPPLPAPNGYTYGAEFGDVDGDGALDLVLLVTDVPLVQPICPRLFHNSGTGSFVETTATHLPVPTGTTVRMVLRDFDGDGDPDLYLANVGVDQMLRNDGTGRFLEVLPPRHPQHDEYTTAVQAADLDRDGDLDLVVGTTATAGARLYRNDGNLAFVEQAADLSVLAGAQRLLAHDADRDEDMDLLVIRPDGSTVVCANRHTHAAAPFLALAGQPYELQFACRPGDSGTGRLAIPGMGFALAPVPLALPPLGWFLLEPTALLHPQPWIALDPSTGEGRYRFQVPTQPALLGQFFAVQALAVDPTSSATHLTNVVQDIVRR